MDFWNEISLVSEYTTVGLDGIFDSIRDGENYEEDPSLARYQRGPFSLVGLTFTSTTVIHASRDHHQIG